MTLDSDYKSLDSYFSKLRDRVEQAEGDYPGLSSVREGDSTLEDIATEYETRFSQLLERKAILLDKFRVRKQQDEFAKYAQELEQFIEVLTNLSGKGRFTLYSPQDYYSPLDRYRRQRYGEVDQVLCAGLAIGSIGAIILSFFFPPLWLVLFGAGEVVGTASVFGWPYVDKKGKSSAENFFNTLHEYAGTTDKEIHSAYILDYFADNMDLFKETYRQVDHSYKNHIRTKLTQMQELGILDMSNIELESFLDDCVKQGEENDTQL